MSLVISIFETQTAPTATYRHAVEDGELGPLVVQVELHGEVIESPAVPHVYPAPRERGPHGSWNAVDRELRRWVRAAYPGSAVCSSRCPAYYDLPGWRRPENQPRHENQPRQLA